jgi:stearoyl-CoA desaturase (Delta-9 desaturase)
MPPPKAADTYNGVAPFPDTAPGALPVGGSLQIVVTAALAVLPLAGLAVAVWLAWGHGVGLADLLLMAGMYTITGLGVTVGYHRYFTHRSFRAVPALRIALAVAGSMAFEGSVVAWVATHRRHHAFSDRPGDPHSPYRFGTSIGGMLRGLLHAHMGWMFHADPTPADRYVPDLLADRVMRKISAAFPALSVASLAIPFGLGWAIGGDLRAALLALLWGGAVRIALLQHVTWSVNSLCHVIGNRPFTTRQFDRATNLWPLALLSFGESWHNLHHSDPTSARHGVGRGQIDLSAGLIRIFELLGLATNVRWPSPDRIQQHLRPEGADGPDGIAEPGGVPEPADTVPDRVLTPAGR